MAVNFSKNQDEITKAWRTVVNSENVPNWALFGYEGSTNVIKLMATGSKGIEELVEELNCSLIQYAFCRVIDTQVGLNKLVLINWQGESAPLSRKGLCASHVGDVSNYFKGCTQTITIRNDDEATKEHLMEQIMKTSASRINLSCQQQQPSSLSSNISTNFVDNDTGPSSRNSDVSTNSSSTASKTQVTSDIAANRKSFWQQQEEEEKERLAEEKRRAAEKQAQFERERKQKEELEAKKLAETIEQRDRLIDATRRADRKAASNSSASSSTTGSSQPSSVLSIGPTTANDPDDDDGRVGRRSELIRLERNQETQSLISKGLIKNKRAIFEQQANQSKQQQNQPTLSRRSSGAMITQRLNAFKSLDVSGVSMSNDVTSSPAATVTTSVDKLANGFAKKLSVSGDESLTTGPTPIKKEVQKVKLTNDEDQSLSNVSITRNDVKSEKNMHDGHNNRHIEEHPIPSDNKSTATEITDNSSPKNCAQPKSEQHQSTPKQDVNGNSKQVSPSKQRSVEAETVVNGDALLTQTDIIGNDELLMLNGNISEAIALFDYEAADNTEISFDPNDKIGFIQKVDPGWWQGKVMSGRFKGQIGLFPSNYVKEL